MKHVRWLFGIAAAAGLAVTLLEGRPALQRESQPVPAESQRLLEQLVGSDPAARDEAYSVLAKSPHRALGALFPVLEAYRDGLLERTADGRLVIYMPRVEIAGRKVFPLVDAGTLKPVARPVDIHLSGGKVYLVEYTRELSLMGPGKDQPGRVLELAPNP